MDQPFTLTDVVTNSELARRSSRAPDYQAEIEAMNMLAETLAHSSAAPFYRSSSR